MPNLWSIFQKLNPLSMTACLFTKSRVVLLLATSFLLLGLVQSSSGHELEFCSETLTTKQIEVWVKKIEREMRIIIHYWEETCSPIPHSHIPTGGPYGPVFDLILKALDKCLMDQARARLSEEGCGEDEEDSSSCAYPNLFENRGLLDAPTPRAEANLMCGDVRAYGCYGTNPPDIRVDMKRIYDETTDPWGRLIEAAGVIIHERLHHTGWRHEDAEEPGHPDYDETTTRGPVTKMLAELWRDSSFDQDCAGF